MLKQQRKSACLLACLTSCTCCGCLFACCSKDVQGILSDAAGAFEKVLPLPEIEEMRALIEATINGTLDILQVRSFRR
jgi:hypothetical protein